MRPAIPFRSSDATSNKTMTAATCARCGSASPGRQQHARPSRAPQTSMTIASTNGNNDTNEKKTHSTTYCVALGWVSEMSFSASGINTARIRQRGARANNGDRGRTGDLADLRDHALDAVGSGGRRRTRTNHDGKNDRGDDVDDRDPRLRAATGCRMPRYRRSRTRRSPQRPTSRSARRGRTTGRYTGADPPRPARAPKTPTSSATTSRQAPPARARHRSNPRPKPSVGPPQRRGSNRPVNTRPPPPPPPTGFDTTSWLRARRSSSHHLKGSCGAMNPTRDIRNSEKSSTGSS